MAIHPASLYRNASRIYLIDYLILSGSKIGIPREIQAEVKKLDPNELKSNLEKAYSDHQIMIQDAIIAHQATKFETSSMGLGLIAMGLFAFGESNKSSDILHAIEVVSKNKGLFKVHSLLSNSLTAMLPLPLDIRPKENVNAIRSWLEEHRKRLQWDEEMGIYTWLSQ